MNIRDSVKQRFEQAARDVKPLPPVAAAMLRRILAAPARCGWDNNKLSGRLDRRAFGHAVAGSESVFKQRWETEGVDTAVMILVDGSGSMSSRRMTLAASAAVKLARVIRTVRGCDMGVAVFDSSTRAVTRADDISAGGFEFDGTGRADHSESNVAPPANIRALRRFGSGPQLSDAQLMYMQDMSRGGTPDLSAIQWGVAELTHTPAKRKLLITITDGLSNFSTAIPGVIAEANERGVDVVCIGIEFDVKRTYGIGCKVMRPEDMDGPAFKQIADALRARDMNRRTV